LLWQGELWLGLLVGLVYYLASASVFWAVYDDIPHAPHPYLTGLSVVGGVTAFPPAWHGALVGPLLLVTMSLIVNLYRSFLAKGRKDHQSVHKMRQVQCCGPPLSRHPTYHVYQSLPSTRTAPIGSELMHALLLRVERLGACRVRRRPVQCAAGAAPPTGTAAKGCTAPSLASPP
jgi:hypothetical protein